MEPRTFEQERPVGEFLRINPRGKTDRQLLVAALQQAEATHGCLEKHIAETRLAHLTASEARQKLEGKVDDLCVAVGAMDTRQDIVEGSVSALAKSLGAQITGPRSIKVEGKLGPMEVLKLAGAIGGALAFFVFAYQLLRAAWPAIDAYLAGLSPI
jgi:hypothetical protein